MRMLNILLIFLPCIAVSQNCRIVYVFNTPETLKKNKVKEVKMYVKDKNKPAPDYHYTFDEKGCAVRHIQTHNIPTGVSSVTESVQWNPEKKERRYAVSAFIEKHDSIFTYLTETESYSATGKLLKRVKWTNDGTEHIETEFFDPDGFKKSEVQSVHKIPGGDTLYTVYDMEDKNSRIRILRNKKDGKWTETEKGVWRLRNGEIEEAWFYTKGELISHYVPGKDPDVREEYGFPPDDNPLPVPDEAIDTIYADAPDATKKIKGKNAGNSKYTIALHYEHPDRQKVRIAEVFHSKSGLLFMRVMHFNPAMNEVFEYSFR